MQYRTLTFKEESIIRMNVIVYDKLFKILIAKCLNCGFPLPMSSEARTSIPFVGEVCGLCSAMHNALYGRAYWRELHRVWKEENERRASAKRRMTGHD